MTDKKDTRTITVEGYFSEKQVTKDEFINIWQGHARQLQFLSYGEEYNKFAMDAYDKVSLEAARMFEVQYSKENKEAA